MADYDVLDMAVMLRDAQRSLRKLFPDYEEKAEPCRQLLRRIMADMPTDKPLVALTTALQAIVDSNGGEYGDTQKIQTQSLWMTAAAYDLVMEQHSQSSAERVMSLIDRLGLGEKKKR